MTVAESSSAFGISPRPLVQQTIRTASFTFFALGLLLGLKMPNTLYKECQGIWSFFFYPSKFLDFSFMIILYNKYFFTYVRFPTYCKHINLHIQKIYLSLPLLQTNSCLGHFTSVHHKPKFKDCNCAEDMLWFNFIIGLNFISLCFWVW